ncbi:MAG TPA: ABC transporter substrate-binding protein [Streptosporangiaceae bacterium]|jgi:ABC-type branched-subunit amino acid transport system substrate-binding protein
MRTRQHATTAAVAGFAAVALVVAGCGSSGGGNSTSSSNTKLTASAPGITATTITIGSHQPLTGIAAPGYSEIAPAAQAYFNYVNAHGGIYGRKIVYKFLDDAYDPSKTTTVVHQLVLQDNVYAIFNGLGTPTHLAVAPFLNQSKVPDVFVASGCECWNNTSQLPWTTGWQLDYVREGKILGNYIEQHFKGKKIGLFFQDDEFGQDGVKGLKYEIPAKQIVSAQSYSPANTKIAPQVAALKAAGAQVVVSFSVPAFTALLKLNMLGLKYNPQLAVSDVGSDPITLAGLLAAFAKNKTPGFGNSLTNGIITDGYLPSLGDTGSSWIKLFQQVHTQYIPKLPFDGNVAYGLAVGYTFVQAMFKAGRNPTRQDLLNAINAGLPQGPSVAPFAYSSSDHNGITGAFMGVIKNGAIVPKGPVLTTDDSPTGAVSPDTTPQPPAPSSGIPSP